MTAGNWVYHILFRVIAMLPISWLLATLLDWNFLVCYPTMVITSILIKAIFPKNVFTGRVE